MSALDFLKTLPAPYTETPVSEAQGFARREADRIRRTAPLLDHDARDLINAITTCAGEGLQVALKDVGVDGGGHLTCTLEIRNTDVNRDGQMFYRAEAYVRSAVDKTPFWRATTGKGLVFSTLRRIERLAAGRSPSVEFLVLCSPILSKTQYGIARPLMAAVEDLLSGGSSRSTDEDLVKLSDKIAPGFIKEIKARRKANLRKIVDKSLDALLVDLNNGAGGLAVDGFDGLGPLKEVLKNRDKYVEDYIRKLVDELDAGNGRSWEQIVKDTREMADEFNGKHGDYRSAAKRYFHEYFQLNASKMEEALKAARANALEEIKATGTLQRPMRGQPHTQERIYQKHLKAEISKKLSEIVQNAGRDWEKYAVKYERLYRLAGGLRKILKPISAALDLWEAVTANDWVTRTGKLIEVGVQSFAVDLGVTLGLAAGGWAVGALGIASGTAAAVALPVLAAVAGAVFFAMAGQYVGEKIEAWLAPILGPVLEDLFNAIWAGLTKYYRDISPFPIMQSVASVKS